MQHVRSLVINQRPILARRMQPIGKHERLVFAGGFHFPIVRAIRLDLAQVGRASEAMLEIRRGHESRDAFVKPEVVPVTTRHHVAPPLMRKLVRAKPNVLFVVEHLLAVSLSQSREATHLLFDTAGGQHLRVRFIGILNTGARFVEVEHVGRVAKDATHFALTVFGREILKLNFAVFLLYELKWTRRKTEDVSGTLRTLLPDRKSVV